MSNAVKKTASLRSVHGAEAAYAAARFSGAAAEGAGPGGEGAAWSDDHVIKLSARDWDMLEKSAEEPPRAPDPPLVNAYRDFLRAEKAAASA